MTGEPDADRAATEPPGDSKAPGDGAAPLSQRRVRRSSLSEAIYGTILWLSLIAALSLDDQISALEIAVSMLVTVFVFWLAHVYSNLLARWVESHHRLDRAGIRRLAREEWPLVTSALPPAGILLLAQFGLYAKAAGVTIALVFGVVSLAGWGVAAGRQAGLTTAGMIGVGALSATFGLVVVALKALVQH
jgi:hypothetical protein